MKRSAVAVSMLAALLVSCDSPLEPEWLAGAYVLRNTPVELHAGSGLLTILADTLYMGSDLTTRRLRDRWEGVEGTYEGARSESYGRRIRLGRLELTYICPPNALCSVTPGPHMWGYPTRAGLTLRSAVDPSVPLHYERLPTNLRAP